MSRTSASAGDVARAGSTHESKNEKIRLSTHSALRYTEIYVLFFFATRFEKRGSSVLRWGVVAQCAVRT